MEPTEDEVWRPVDGWPYHVSSLGRVRRTGNIRRRSWAGTIYEYIPDRILSPSTHATGYMRVNLCANRIRKSKFVHLLVCEAFHGPAPSPDHEVAHWDADRTNNRAGNLRWVTRQENAADKVRQGREQKGENHGRAILSNEQVIAIRGRRAEKIRRLAEEYAVSEKTIQVIRYGVRWTHLP